MPKPTGRVLALGLVLTSTGLHGCSEDGPAESAGPTSGEGEGEGEGPAEGEGEGEGERSSEGEGPAEGEGEEEGEEPGLEPEHCGDGFCTADAWCRVDDDGAETCAPFTLDDEVCVDWIDGPRRCAPGLECVGGGGEDDLPVCRRPCVANDDCPEDRYCSAGGWCYRDGACDVRRDCTAPGNDWGFPPAGCDCDVGSCEWGGCRSGCPDPACCPEHQEPPCWQE